MACVHLRGETRGFRQHKHAEYLSMHTPLECTRAHARARTHTLTEAASHLLIFHPPAQREPNNRCALLLSFVCWGFCVPRLPPEQHFLSALPLINKQFKTQTHAASPACSDNTALSHCHFPSRSSVSPSSFALSLGVAKAWHGALFRRSKHPAGRNWKHLKGGK